jgi:erythromycin esterase-like protein
MWRNADVLDFVGWLREHNDEQEFEDRKCGFYGLDLYSLSASIAAVLAYLNKVDPEAAKRARHHYSCFEQFGKKAEAYGYATAFGMSASCESAVVRELVELRRKAMDYLQRDGQIAADAYFNAEQNALVVRNAEEYYRNMFRREVSSWNLRDTHMMESLLALTNHLSRKGSPAKIIVWADNSHLGDARATNSRGGTVGAHGRMAGRRRRRNLSERAVTPLGEVPLRLGPAFRRCRARFSRSCRIAQLTVSFDRVLQIRKFMGHEATKIRHRSPGKNVLEE